MSARYIATTVQPSPVLVSLHPLAEVGMMPLSQGWMGCRRGHGGVPRPAGVVAPTESPTAAHYEVTVTFRVAADDLEEIVARNMNDVHCLDVRVQPVRGQQAIRGLR
ncbi:MAG: hypothetical protein HY270_16425 [Deltaproteobacteria bacterium]|nr:hypothetical protein [Deltaproteobacteria bacterium]